MAAIIMATLPGLLICYAMYRADKYEKEPLWALGLFFAAGAFVTVPAIRVELWVMDMYGLRWQRSWSETILLAFGVVALWEELLKWCVLLLVFNQRFFNEPLDGIVYAVMVGMGFATLENIAFLERFGPDSLLVRAFTAIPAHLVFAVVQGYYLGKAKFKNGGKVSPTERNRLVLYGFLVAFLLHGAYDLLIFQDRWQWLFLLATATTYLCLFYAADMIFEHLEHSPFKKELKQKEPLREE
ncbi:MAG: PrsW family intramembrane metalloprotease [Chitinophagales bacterium]